MQAGDSHPERPHRLTAMYHHLVAAGLANRCLQITGSECTADEVLLVHTPAHRAAVESCQEGGITQVGGATYACLDSSRAARLATGLFCSSLSQGNPKLCADNAPYAYLWVCSVHHSGRDSSADITTQLSTLEQRNPQPAMRGRGQNH